MIITAWEEMIMIISMKTREIDKSSSSDQIDFI